VADEEQRATGIAQCAHYPEQLRAFALRQRCGRLVEDEYARFMRQGARNLHHMLLRDAQPAGRHIGVEIGTQLAQYRCRPCAQLRPFHQAPLVGCD
jgi:hypothetical protein